MLENDTSNAERRTGYWTITGEGSDRSDVLTIDLDGGGAALVVFGFREEADLFLGFREKGGWQVRETTADEIVSALDNSRAGTDRVVIDPLPASICNGSGLAQPSMSRADFTRFLLRTMRSASGLLPSRS